MFREKEDFFRVSRDDPAVGAEDSELILRHGLLLLVEGLSCLRDPRAGAIDRSSSRGPPSGRPYVRSRAAAGRAANTAWSRPCSFSAANVPPAIDRDTSSWRMLTWVSLSDRF